ncbi:MAG: hypothetical protein IJ285_00960 [Clostridia bacterium]|nr:hypothetical protein [Clostridia bacterium]
MQSDSEAVIRQLNISVITAAEGFVRMQTIRFLTTLAGPFVVKFAKKHIIKINSKEIV